MFIFVCVFEFNCMLLKFGIGVEWIKCYNKDVYFCDVVIVCGYEFKFFCYYDKFL